MPSLRQLVDGRKSAFDCLVAAHNKKLAPRYGTSRVEAASKEIRQAEARMNAVMQQYTELRSQAQDVNRYVYEVAAMGQQEYRRGYQDGYRDGMQAAAKPTQKELPPTVKAAVLQNRREVDLEE